MLTYAQLELELVESGPAADAAADDDTAPAVLASLPLRQSAGAAARELLLGSMLAGRPEYLTLDELAERYAAQVAELRASAAAEPDARKRRAAERYAAGVESEIAGMLASSRAWYAAAPLREQQLARYAEIERQSAAGAALVAEVA